MLLGQTGLLSFGHAVYYGLGALFTIHALNFAAAGWHFPVTLMPLVGAAGGLAFGIVLGYVTTRRAGTTFAMISLGVGEMVAACSLMFPAFFGGEAGISANRTIGEPFLGITYGPQIQM
jgi:branched-chain amino acid transport system permease protein